MRRGYNVSNPEDPWYVCPACGTTDFKVLESRMMYLGRRRRYHCRNCGHRETTFEISQSELDRLKLADRLYRYAAKVFQGTAPPSGPTCDQCVHFNNAKCTMGIPEAGDDYATECAIFTSAQ